MSVSQGQVLMERKARHAAQRSQRYANAAQIAAATPDRGVLQDVVDDDSPPLPVQSRGGDGGAEYPPLHGPEKAQKVYGWNYGHGPASIELLQEDLLAKEAELARAQAEVRMLKSFLQQERAKRAEAVALAKRTMYNTLLRVFRSEGVRGVESRRDELLAETSDQVTRDDAHNGVSGGSLEPNDVYRQRQHTPSATSSSTALAELRRKEALQLQMSLINSARRRYQHSLAT